ncbi:hypothetical protein DYB38_003216 [Aphanomyces astaci]|uniref:Kinesin motor domain-containing protein n=2 Tax=Aphanomyces astaci TaxID=112090 RepID=A0A397CRB2_APHAT|nr:hypothetical protein DYB38_003216 [Aphanomyces astaci]RHZ19618.1 hypothetical protein DYB31_002767 [Aphanomyces astaci]
MEVSRKSMAGSGVTRYFAPKASSENHADTNGNSHGFMTESWNGHRRRSSKGSNQAEHDSPVRSVPLGSPHDNHNASQAKRNTQSHIYDPTTSSTGVVPSMQKWKMSSSSRHTDTSSDELANDNDADNYFNMDQQFQVKLLYCRTPEDKVRVYKEHVCALLHELVMIETHSEELEYELKLKIEAIQQLRQKVDSLTAPEAFHTLREFEDSADFTDKIRVSQGESHALCRKLEAEVRIFRERATASEATEAKLRHQLAAKEADLAHLSEAHRQLQADLRNEAKRRDESDKKAVVLRDKLDALRRSPSLQSSLDDALSQSARFESMAETQQGVIRAHEATIAALTRQVQGHELTIEASDDHLRAALRAKDAEVQAVTQGCRDELEAMAVKFKQCELVRRTLHNQVMELKGNIRVFCRVRPHLAAERSSSFGRHVADEVYLFPDYDKDKRRVVLVADAKTHTSYAQHHHSCSTSSSSNDSKKWAFEFDQVFNCNATQHDMFQEVAALVQSAVDGYNVSILAYGQTGSGKTYTMQGDEQALAEHSPNQWPRIPDLGIVGRAMAHLFATCAKQRDHHGWEFTISFEMYEIYNDTIRDLMAVPPSNLAASGGHDVTHVAQLDADGRVHVSNLTVTTVRDEVHAMQLLKQATSRRSVKKTNRNDVSSRSHCITTLKYAKLTGVHPQSESVRQGAVYLVDLARLKSSGSGNDPVMLKEAQNINKSLACLGNVISAIASKKAHVPFRDSKLTYVLQNTLGQDSKTLMICTLSPLEEHRDGGSWFCFYNRLSRLMYMMMVESLNTLRFAKKVNTCELAASK